MGGDVLSPAHRGRMERLKAREGFRRKRDTPAYFAAMYLLTANDDLFLRSANCFCRHGIEFDYGTLKDISPHSRDSPERCSPLSYRRTWCRGGSPHAPACIGKKKPEVDKIVLTGDTLRKYFPRSYTPRKMEETIIKLLEAWQKKRQRSQER